MITWNPSKPMPPQRHPTRRDVILRSPEAIALLGGLALVWPMLEQMRPSPRVRLKQSHDFDIGTLAPGTWITELVSAAPVVVRRLTPAELAAERDVALEDLKDTRARNANNPEAPATLANRLVAPDSDLLVVIGVCTHLGCLPINGSGNFGGFFCPCHGSQYDTVGRIRSGPAKQNLAIPVHSFLDEQTLRVG